MARVIFTDEDKAKMIKQHDEGMSYAALAAIYGVAPITINRICNPDVAERQRKARQVYAEKTKDKKMERQKKNFRRYNVTFHNVNDKKIIAHLDNKDNINGYLRNLILSDIEQEESKTQQ